LDKNGIALPEGAAGELLSTVDNAGNPLPANNYRLDFYHSRGTGFTATFSPDNGATILEFSGVCDGCQNPIPTLTQWSLVILGLIMLILGMVFMEKRKRLTVFD
jgi:hypothetical protein